MVDEFSSGEALLERFAPAAYDLIFLDQFMEGLSGLDTARRIRARDNLVPLVFVTTSRDHAIDSFGVRACGYLVKPFADEDFARTMEAAGWRAFGPRASSAWIAKSSSCATSSTATRTTTTCSSIRGAAACCACACPSRS